ncbi:hypothetical protein EH183_37120 [Streptomyces sp. CB01881]|nr:hypothetical protein C2142_37090 [Streptomyces sp. CB01881]TYC69812.1 hypothetical protein EH183_37120 [Streptomyces sp. CB01881]
MDEGETSRFEGADQHGWSGDIDAEDQEPNDSARRSFDPETHAPEPGPGREPSEEEHDGVPGDTVESAGRRGEDQGPPKHHRDLGPRGPSGRPSGRYTAGTRSGVDPEGPDAPASGH